MLKTIARAKINLTSLVVRVVVSLLSFLSRRLCLSGRLVACVAFVVSRAAVVVVVVVSDSRGQKLLSLEGLGRRSSARWSHSQVW